MCLLSVLNNGNSFLFPLDLNDYFTRISERKRIKISYASEMHDTHVRS